jgi:antitoxin (DNA-binding transcriptional repressor) of toxin-antitoxin stability system
MSMPPVVRFGAPIAGTVDVQRGGLWWTLVAAAVVDAAAFCVAPPPRDREELRPLEVRALVRRHAAGRGSDLRKQLPGVTFLPVRSVDIKTLKNKLSEYVRIAASGETVLVTDGDRIVAELNPPREGRGPVVSDAVLLEDLRRGLITPASMPFRGPPPRGPVAPTEQILRELDADREDR